jgi:hypothetical protein
MKTLKTTTVTDEQLATLRDEAASAGDMEQVRLCAEALEGNSKARTACAAAIEAARANEE